MRVSPTHASGVVGILGAVLARFLLGKRDLLHTVFDMQDERDVDPAGESASADSDQSRERAPGVSSHGPLLVAMPSQVTPTLTPPRKGRTSTTQPSCG